MPTPGPLELVIILVIALLILGPGRLPDVGSALGKSLREFRKAASDVEEATKIDTSPLPNPPEPPQSTAATPPPAPNSAGDPASTPPTTAEPAPSAKPALSAEPASTTTGDATDQAGDGSDS